MHFTVNERRTRPNEIVEKTRPRPHHHRRNVNTRIRDVAFAPRVRTEISATLTVLVYGVVRAVCYSIRRPVLRPILKISRRETGVGPFLVNGAVRTTRRSF